MSTKLILLMFSYTVSKLVRFLRHSEFVITIMEPEFWSNYATLSA